MLKIKISKNRWLIWAVFFIITSLFSLSAYILYVAETDSLDIPIFFKSKHKQVIETSIVPWMKFIPKEWTIIAQTQGDFNVDGFNDLAIVAEDTNVNLGPEVKYSFLEIHPRTLIVLLADGQGGYTLNLRNDNAILLNGDGGAGVGDPFADNVGSIKFEDGLLKISFYGGSNWRWNDEYDFIFTGNRFLLVNLLNENSFILDPDLEDVCDYNYDFQKNIKTSLCGSERKSVTKTKIKSGPKVFLDDFKAGQFNTGIFE